MKEYHKLKVCLIKEGTVTTEFPDDFLFERNVLESLSLGYKQNIKQFTLPNGEVFLMGWRSSSDEKALLERHSFPHLNPLRIAQLLDDKNWFEMDFIFEIQLKHLKKVALK